MNYYDEEDRRKLNELLSMGSISSDGRLNGQYNLTLASLMADNNEPGVKFAQPQFQQGEMDRNREQFAREDVRAMERGFNPQQFQSPQPAPLAPQAPEPQNFFQRSGGEKISLDRFAQPAQQGGDQILGRQRTPDGGEVIYKRVMGMDGFGRQSQRVVQEFVPPPDYAREKQDLDSVLKGLQIKKAERDLNAPIPGEKPPAGYRFTPSGDLVPITGGPADPRNQADKPLTEFQGKSAAFGTRAAVAHGILNSVGDGGKVQPGMIKRSLEAVPWAGEGLGTLSNWTQSPKQQQVDQAQRDFVNAVLRQESGAAIGPDEFANATKQYFPQPGDSPDVIRQKAENRETAIAGFELNAGNRGGAAVRAAGGSVNTVTPPGSPAHKTDWLARAKAKNPGMSGAALEAEYLKKFRG